MVVKVPAGALRPTSGNPCHRSYAPHSCELLLLAVRRAIWAGQAFDASFRNRRSNSPRVLVQERLHDCGVGELTQTLQPILPQSPNYQGASWDCGHLWQMGAKTYTKAEGSKTTEGTRRGAKLALLHPSRSAEAGFLALLTCLPMPMPAPALDTVSTTRRAQLSC